MSKQIQRAKLIYQKDMIFMYAWNEWAEGGYLEPDERTGYKNLEAIRDALKENDVWYLSHYSAIFWNNGNKCFKTYVFRNSAICMYISWNFKNTWYFMLAHPNCFWNLAYYYVYKFNTF